MSGPQGWAAPDDRAPDAPPVAPPPSGPGPDRPTSSWQPPPWQAPPGWGGPQQQAPGWGGPSPGGGHTGWGTAPPAPGQAGWGPPGYGAWGAPRPPDIRPGIVPLRPLGLGEVLDGAVSVIRRYPRPTLGLSAVLAVIISLLNIPLLIASYDSPLLDGSAFEPGSTVELDGAAGELLAGFGATTLLSFLSGVVLAGVITAVVGKGVLGQPMTLGDAWAQVRPLLPRLIGLAVLVVAVVYGAFLVAVGVGVGLAVAAGPAGAAFGVLLALVGVGFAVYVYVRLALAPSALVLERIGIGASLRRSGVLVKNDWLRVFGILLLTLVITTFVSSVLQAPFQVTSFFDGLSGETTSISTLDVVLQTIGSTLALTLVAPFDAAVRALLYVDRRMRAEGLDVALTAAAASARSA